MAKLLLRRFKRVLIDVNTQYDLVYQNGCVNLVNRPDMLRNIRRLIAWARVRHIPVISTAISRRQASCPEVLTNQNALCLENTPGQKKIRYTMLHHNVLFEPDNRMDLPRHLLSDYQQVIFEIRSEDPFALPRADRLLSELKADEFIVFGIGINSAVKHTVLGLKQRRKHVTLVQDAVEHDKNINVGMCLRKLYTKGAESAETAQITGQSRLSGQVGHSRPWHTPMLINARIG